MFGCKRLTHLFFADDLIFSDRKARSDILALQLKILNFTGLFINGVTLFYFFTGFFMLML